MLGSITKETFNQLLGRFSTAELENMLEKHPYFQQAHVLLAKKYQKENNSKFDEQLQLAALYTQDREFLFSIFNETITPSVFKIPEPIIENAAEQPGEVKVLSPQPKEEIVTQTEQVSEQEKETFRVAEPHTFDEWLGAFAATKPIKLEFNQKQISAEPEKQDDELEQLIMTNLPVHELVEEETHYSKGLDVFIEEQKQKHRQSEIRMPAYENELAPELMTETMAKIYEMQKKFAKAIQAYEILALKYPEKNDFFAARINYLKNII